MPDTYNSLIAGQTLTVSDPAKGVIANDINVYGVKLLDAAGQRHGDSQRERHLHVCSQRDRHLRLFRLPGERQRLRRRTVTLGAAPIEGGSGITMGNISFTSNVATSLSIKPPGILAADTDAAGYPLTVNAASVVRPDRPRHRNAFRGCERRLQRDASARPAPTRLPTRRRTHRARSAHPPRP